MCDSSPPHVTEKPTPAWVRTHEATFLEQDTQLAGNSAGVSPTSVMAYWFKPWGRLSWESCNFLRILSLMGSAVLPGATFSIWSKYQHNRVPSPAPTQHTVKSNRQHVPLLHCTVGLSQLAMMKSASKWKPQPPRAMLMRSEGCIRYFVVISGQPRYVYQIITLYPVPHLVVLLIIICQLKSPSVKVWAGDEAGPGRRCLHSPGG